MDAAFNRVAALPLGEPVRLRWIRPNDAPLIRDGYTRLSAESRYMRFFSAMRELPEPMLRYLTNVDGEDHAALVALSIPETEEGIERAVGVARFVRDGADVNSAEVAVTVADDMQRRGLGTLLVVTLGAAARERAVETFTARILFENVRARKMLKRLDAAGWNTEGDVANCFVSTAALARRAAERWRLASLSPSFSAGGRL